MATKNPRNTTKRPGKSGKRKVGRPAKAPSKLHWAAQPEDQPVSRPSIYVTSAKDLARVEELARVAPALRQALDDLRALHGDGIPLELIDAAVEQAADASSRAWAEETGLPEPVPIDFSTDPIAAKTQAAWGGILKGGSPVADPQALYEAFAILLDLMNEAAESVAPQAAPECVYDHASRFIDQMKEFAISRAEASSWVLAQQLVPPLKAFFIEAASRWPKRSRKGAGRVPLSPSADEQRALDEQEQALAQVLSRNGFDASLPGTRDAIIASRAAGWYIRGELGPKKMGGGSCGTLRAAAREEARTEDRSRVFSKVLAP